MNDDEINKNDDQNVMAAAEDIQLEIFDDFEALAAMQPQWDDFVEAMDGEIFLTYDWCRVWWKHYGSNRTLRVFLFYNNGSIAGIIPMFFETIRLGPVCLKAAKVVGTDFTIAQICLPIRPEFLQIVMEKFFAEMREKFTWDIICLGPFAGQYRDFGLLYHTCRRLLSNQWQVKKIRSGVQTYFELADSWEKYLTGLTNKQKDELKRNYNMLAKAVATDEDKVVQRIAQEDTIDEMFVNFVRMHQLQWQEMGKLGHFGDWPGSEEFHREVARAQLIHDRLRLLEIKFEDSCLGYEYSFRCGRNYLNFLGARFISEQLSRISIGKITFGEMVKAAISERMDFIDSSQGRYEHKLRMGGKLFPIHKVQIMPQHVTTQIRVTIFRFLAKLLHLWYYRVWFCRIAPRLPLKRKPLWKCWIKSKSLT